MATPHRALVEFTPTGVRIDGDPHPALGQTMECAEFIRLAVKYPWLPLDNAVLKVRPC